MVELTYVRSEMVAPREAPGSEIGIASWAREKLFSGWFNTALTLISLYAIYYLISHIGPWFAHSVWNATSLQDCRRIITETWGEGATGACFAVIRERWKQYLFGFYPANLYWRPTLAFVLMFVALAPILFSGLPRKMLWFSLLFPGVAYWLLWGGSIFVPVVIYAGFVIGFLVHNAISARGSALLATIAGLLAPVIWWLYLAGPVAGLLAQSGILDLTKVTSKQFGGFTLSLTIGITGIAFSLPLGILLALGRRSDYFVVHTLCVCFIEFVRGVPLITLLFVASVMLSYLLPPGTNFDLVLRVVIMVTLFASAYIAEVIRGGLAALPKGQYEAGDAMGLDYWQSMRLIILPQALKISIPGIVNNFIGLFKDTTLVAIIALLDPLGLTTAIRADSNWNGIIWELYGFVALIFFLFCYSMSQYSQYLERKLRTGHR